MKTKQGGDRVQQPLPGVRSGQTLGNMVISGINSGAHIYNGVRNQFRSEDNQEAFTQPIKGNFSKGYYAEEMKNKLVNGGKSKKLRKSLRKSRKTRRKSYKKRSTKRSRK